MESKKKKAYEIQGIVLIDELETHLHVDLQKKIFPFLTKVFPKIQFIISTHSPFILNSVPNAIVYDLENRILMEDLSAYSYKGIVEGYFNVDQYSESIKAKLEEYEELVQKATLTKENEVQIVKLRIYLKQVIPTNLAPEFKIRFQQIELERRGKKK